MKCLNSVLICEIHLLLTSYRREIRLTGLLYFHRISDNRMAGTPLKNLRMFENLCGEDFKGIILTTTMWSDVDEELGVERERELKTDYWKSMIERGSSVRRFLYTRQSAFEILAPIWGEVDKRSALLLQIEMNDLQLQIRETSAGKTLYIELEELVARHHDILERIRRELREPMDDPDQLQLLMEEYQKVSVQLQRATEDMRRMKTSKGRRIRGFVIVNWRRIFRLVMCPTYYALLYFDDVVVCSQFMVKKKRAKREVQALDQVNEGETETWEVESRDSARVWVVNLWEAEEKASEERMEREKEVKKFVTNLQESKRREWEAKGRERVAKEFWETEETKILEEEWKTKARWEANEWDAKLWETKERVAKLWLDKLWEPDDSDQISLTLLWL